MPFRADTRVARLALVTLAVFAGFGTIAGGVAARDAAALLQGPQSVAPLANKLIDAVVNISTSQTVRGPQGLPIPKVPRGSPFEDFFEDYFNKRGAGPRADRKISSLGSGFVIDGKQGLVVTNNHVIADAEEIIINFHDGSKLKVDKVLGRDTKADLALLKVSPKTPLPEVKFGSSSDLLVGDWVMAIGNPFGLGGSVTVGIISAKQRDINSGPYDDYLQTDAAINKGNSGGPLFNMNGDVVGVNTAIISPTGGSIGIGFAVPSDTVVAIVEQLKQFGEPRRGWLGVKIQSVTEDIAETLGLQENTGALVSAVTPDSPAAKAGLQSGDVILKFDGKDISTMRGLPKIVAQTMINKSVPVEILRKGAKQTVNVTVGLLVEEAEPVPAKATPVEPPPAAKTEPEKPVLGLTMQPLNEELRTKYGFGEGLSGLVVTEVDPLSAAGEKGIKEGDLIVEAAQEALKSVGDFRKTIDRVKKAGRQALLLRIENAQKEMTFVAVPIN